MPPAQAPPGPADPTRGRSPTGRQPGLLLPQTGVRTRHTAHSSIVTAAAQAEPSRRLWAVASGGPPRSPAAACPDLTTGLDAPWWHCQTLHQCHLREPGPRLLGWPPPHRLRTRLCGGLPGPGSQVRSLVLDNGIRGEGRFPAVWFDLVFGWEAREQAGLTEDAGTSVQGPSRPTASGEAEGRAPEHAKGRAGEGEQGAQPRRTGEGGAWSQVCVTEEGGTPLRPGARAHAGNREGEGGREQTGVPPTQRMGAGEGQGQVSPAPHTAMR